MHFEDFFQVRRRRRTYPSSLSLVQGYWSFQIQYILMRCCICLVILVPMPPSKERSLQAAADVTVFVQIEVVALSNFEEKEDQFKQQASLVRLSTVRAPLVRGPSSILSFDDYGCAHLTFEEHAKNDPLSCT